MTTRAAIYLRISLDATGEGLAIERQRDDCLRIVKDRGWTVADEYVDNSISASDARKNRPAYDRLVRDFEAGAFDALVCYDLDRLTRQPRQLEDWIDAAEGRSLALVTANGEADLSTDGGRLFARLKSAVARGEVERKSARQTAAARQRASKGKPPMGVRLTGYTVAGEIVEDEAELIRWMFSSFGERGQTLRGMARTLDEKGVETRRGNPWSASSIRAILTNPRYAGRAIYQGKETGKRGDWEALVSDDLFNVVQSLLEDPRRTTNGTGTARQHLGSGLYRCAVCEEPVTSWSGRRYRCRNGAHVNRARPIVDAFVRDVIAARLTQPDVAGLLDHTPNLQPLLDEVNRHRQRIDSIAADYDAGHIDGTRFAIATEKARAELNDAQRALSAASARPQLAETLGASDPAEAFLSGDLMTQRAVIDAVATIRLHKGTQYSRTFDPDTVEVTWRTN